MNEAFTLSKSQEDHIKTQKSEDLLSPTEGSTLSVPVSSNDNNADKSNQSALVEKKTNEDHKSCESDEKTSFDIVIEAEQPEKKELGRVVPIESKAVYAQEITTASRSCTVVLVL